MRNKRHKRSQQSRKKLEIISNVEREALVTELIELKSRSNEEDYSKNVFYKNSIS